MDEAREAGEDREAENRRSAAAEALFLSRQDFIKDVVRRVARRWRLSREDAADFESDVQLKLLEDDYAVLRKFAGRSRLETYLTTVIHRVFFDSWNRRCGKWRPSAEALRLGPLAVELERLVLREGKSLDEATAFLSAAGNDPVTREDLSRLLAQLPVRVRRKPEDGRDPDGLESPDPNPEESVASQERRFTAKTLQELLTAALARLADEDRLLMKLLHVDGLTIAGITRVLGVEQRPMYRAVERCHREMRRFLEEKGVLPATLERVIDGSEILIRPVRELRLGGEKSQSGPSHLPGTVSLETGGRGEER
jgi:RNA polymerase sigma factor (sigma-70 family)